MAQPQKKQKIQDAINEAQDIYYIGVANIASQSNKQAIWHYTVDKRFAPIQQQQQIFDEHIQ
jgi:hypothetical protein